MKLLERLLDIAAANVIPADSIPCNSQIRIELVSLENKGYALVELIQYGGDSLPDPHKDSWVFLIEFNCAPRQPSRLIAFLIRIDRPAEDLSLQAAISPQCVCCGQFGIDLDGKAGQSEGFNVLFASELIEA